MAATIQSISHLSRAKSIPLFRSLKKSLNFTNPRIDLWGSALVTQPGPCALIVWAQLLDQVLAHPPCLDT